MGAAPGVPLASALCLAGRALVPSAWVLLISGFRCFVRLFFGLKTEKNCPYPPAVSCHRTLVPKPCTPTPCEVVCSAVAVLWPSVAVTRTENVRFSNIRTKYEPSEKLSSSPIIARMVIIRHGGPPQSTFPLCTLFGVVRAHTERAGCL